MSAVNLDEYPCSGKNMNTLVAPWILLTLCRRGGVHGYEIQKIIQGRLGELGLGSNISGLYRHLKALEKRGMVKSSWDFGETGPAKRIYFLTDDGTECLSRWMNTLSVQMSLIGKLLDEGSRIYIPKRSCPVRPCLLDDGKRLYTPSMQVRRRCFYKFTAPHSKAAS